jgi:hypothetical protein
MKNISDEEYNALLEFKHICEIFNMRVQRGEIRSQKTYAAIKEALENYYKAIHSEGEK